MPCAGGGPADASAGGGRPDVASTGALKDNIHAIQDAGCSVADKLMLTAANILSRQDAKTASCEAAPETVPKCEEDSSVQQPSDRDKGPNACRVLNPSFSIGSVVAPCGPLSAQNPPSGASPPRDAAIRRNPPTTTVGFKPTTTFHSAAHDMSMELPASLSIEEILRAPSAPLDDPGSLAILANSVASLRQGLRGTL